MLFGPYTATATYSGDANYSGSSAILNIEIWDNKTSIRLTSSNNPSSYGNNPTFKAIFSGPWAQVDRDEVQWKIDGVYSGSSLVEAGWITSYTPTSLISAGRQIISAEYKDDLQVSGLLWPFQTVDPEPTTTTVASSVAETTFENAVTLCATVVPVSALGTLMGGMEFLCNGHLLGMKVLADGQARLTTILPVGSNSIAARYAGYGNYATSISEPVIINVAAPSIVDPGTGSGHSTHRALDHGEELGSSLTSGLLGGLTDSSTNSITLPSETSNGNTTAEVNSEMVTSLFNVLDGTRPANLIQFQLQTPSDVGRVNISILQSDLDRVVVHTDANVAITSPFVSLTFNAAALDKISGASSEGSVVVSAGVVNPADLSPQDRALVEGRPVFDFTVMNGSTQVSDFGGGSVSVSIHYELQPGETPEGVLVYYLADNGQLMPMEKYSYDAATQSLTFITTHFSKYVIGYDSFTFKDVAVNAWYRTAVEFITDKGITSGISQNQFGPDEKLIRGQFVVLLMKAYGIIPTTGNEQVENFADAGATYYTPYLLEARSRGIVNGVGNNRFVPENEITRQEMFVMLYNALKIIDLVPAPRFDRQLTAFNDAYQIEKWAEEPMLAMVQAGIVTGSNNELNPASSTTRAQMAQVLYRLMSK
jgi:hypothetical protein